MSRKVLFVTGSSADFGKLKPLMRAVDASSDLDCHLFVTGMHMLSLYGQTSMEVSKAGFSNTHRFINQYVGEPREVVLTNTISGLSQVLYELNPDMIIVHGDRVEAHAGAIVGVLADTLVAHIEGGVRSGTADAAVGHVLRRLAHLHFVSNREASDQLRQMGESADHIFEIGFPEFDIMLSQSLPTLERSKRLHGIDFEPYGIVLFHPSTEALGDMRGAAESVVSALLESYSNFVVIYPDNGEGILSILREYERFCHNRRFRVVPSLCFETFLTLLKHARCIVGNSSAGVREAPACGVWTIDVGNPQAGRQTGPSIIGTGYCKTDILAALRVSMSSTPTMGECQPLVRGDSVNRFMKVLNSADTWRISPNKQLRDVPLAPLVA